MTVFFCPVCTKNIEDFSKVCCVDSASQLPILIKNFEVLEGDLKRLRDSKESWYSDTHLNYLQGPYRHHIKKRISYLKDMIKRLKLDSKSTFLDIGCGDGFNLTWLKEHFVNLYGTDYNLLRATRAKNLNLAKIAVADITDYAAHDNSFDVVFFNHVLEHIPDDVKALQEVYRIIKKGGVCILGIPNEGVRWWQWAYKLEPQSRETTDHVHFYTPTSAKNLCTSVGFEIMEVKRLGYGVPHWTIDSLIRQNKFVHDFLDIVGRIFFPNQATSLYLILRK